MPETHDYFWNKRKFISHLKYPRVFAVKDIPVFEFALTVNETEPPYRRGYAWAFRIPTTHTAVVFGKWADDGGPEEERLFEAVGGSDRPVLRLIEGGRYVPIPDDEELTDGPA